MKQRCEGCKYFDCGEKCRCKCHYGVTNKIRQDHGSEDLKSKQKNESKGLDGLEQLAGTEATVEGLSALFG